MCRLPERVVQRRVRTRMTMETPLEITFRNLDHSDAVEARVREKVTKLEQAYGRITSCRVMIEAISRQHVKGNLFHVNTEVGVTGTQVIDRKSGGVGKSGSGRVEPGGRRTTKKK